MNSLDRSDPGHRIAAERHALPDTAITALNPHLAARSAKHGARSLSRLGLGAENAGGAANPFAPDLPAAIHGHDMHTQCPC